MPVTGTMPNPSTSKTATSTPLPGRTLIRRYEEKSEPDTGSVPIGEVTITFHSNGMVDVTVDTGGDRSISYKHLEKAWAKVVYGINKAKRSLAKESV